MKLFETLMAKGRILESDQSKLPKGVLCRGVWPICNIGELNQNNRMYEKAVWDKVCEDAAIRSKMEGRTLFGQAEHPEKTQSDLQLTSHIVTRTFFDNVNEAGKQVEKAFQEIDILDTPCGRIIHTLIEAGCTVGVSTRAEGDLEEKEDEKGNKFHRVVPESYNYVTTDFTADPSTYNVAPVSLQCSLRKELKTELSSESLKPAERQFAVAILETINKPKSIEDLINMEMVKLGAGVVIREGTYKTVYGELKLSKDVKGKITVLREGSVTVQLPDGTSIAGEAGTIEMDQLVITLPDAAPEPDMMEPGLEDELVDDEMDDKMEEEFPGRPSEESPREELPPAFREAKTFESYEHMVDWMQAKFKKAPPNDIQRFNNLVRTKLLNEKITASETSKEIRGLKINEASTRAERDKALEMLDEIEEKLKSVTSSNPLEVRMLMTKLKEAKHTDTDVQAVCKKLEERQTKLNEALKQVKELGKTIKENKVAAGKEIEVVKKSTATTIKEVRNQAVTESNKKLVEKYIDLKLGQSGLSVHKNARALLEKCTSVDDVDEIFEDIKDAMRRDALRPKGKINEVKVEEAQKDPVDVKIHADVKSAMAGMN